MKNLIIIFITSYLLVSCKSYIDTKKQPNNDTYKELKFEYFDNFNTVTVLSRLRAVADNEIYEPQKFTVNLPKKIVNWNIKGPRYYIEYDDKQIIVIDAGYKKAKIENYKWKIIEINDDKIIDYFHDYFENNKYPLEDLGNRKKSRKTVLYTDGNIEILLFNIKEKNLKDYAKSVETFKYL